MKDSIREELIEVIESEGIIVLEKDVSEIHENFFKNYISDENHAKQWIKKHNIHVLDIFEMIDVVDELNENCLEVSCEELSDKEIFNAYIDAVSYYIVEELYFKLVESVINKK